MLYITNTIAILMPIHIIRFPVHTAGVWSCPPTTGENPPPCSDFTFTAIDDRRAVLFGGRNGEQGSMNDVYIIDLPTMVQWFPIKLFCSDKHHHCISKETVMPQNRDSVWFTWTTHLQEYFAIT